MRHLASGKINKALLCLNMVVSLIYIGWWFDFSHIGSPILYGLLFFGELYHVLMIVLFTITIWPGDKDKLIIQPSDLSFKPWVDIFITVAGEPVEVVKQTISAAKQIDYPHFKIHVLNDGLVAQKANWREIEQLAKDFDVNVITRRAAGGAKAGNINSALAQTSGEIVVIFDADMVPKSTFLEKVIPYFEDPMTGFVQTPQFYKNSTNNHVTGGSWEQQEFFFGPIMFGKDKHNAAFICGTNVAIRRQALEEVGGMCEDNIAEDFLTSLFIHQKGWNSHYTREVLSEGLAPEDLLSYYKQQLRWARGSLEVLFGANPLFKNNLTGQQKAHYLASAFYYFNGVIVLIDIIMPIFFLFFGTQPVLTATSSFALFFIPFMFLNLYTIFLAAQGNLTFRAISFSQSSWTLQIQALYSVLTKQKMAFAITPKQALEGNFLNLVYPHLAYIIIALIAIIFAIFKQGITPAVATNVAWIAFNSILFLPFIKAAYNWEALFHPNLTPSKEILNDAQTS